MGQSWLSSEIPPILLQISIADYIGSERQYSKESLESTGLVSK